MLTTMWLNLKFWWSSKIFWYEDLKTKKRNSNFPAKISMKVINAVNQQDYLQKLRQKYWNMSKITLLRNFGQLLNNCRINSWKVGSYVKYSYIATAVCCCCSHLLTAVFTLTRAQSRQRARRAADWALVKATAIWTHYCGVCTCFEKLLCATASCNWSR